MRVHGYCTGCRRIRLVTVTGHAIAMASMKGTNIVEGMCVDCEEEELAEAALRRPIQPWPVGHPRRARLEQIVRDPENAFPEPMIDTRLMRIYKGTATARDRLDVARDEATRKLFTG